MRKFFVILIVVLFCLMIVIQAIFARALKGITLKALNGIVATKAEIDDIGINLFTGLVPFSGLRVENPAGFSEKYFLTIKNGYIKLSFLKLLFRRIEISRIFLEELFVNLEKNKDGIFNTRLIFRKRTAGQEKPAPAAYNKTKKLYFKIDEAIIKNGVFKLANYKVNPEGATALFDQINVSIRNLTPPAEPEEMPTSINCLARLPAKDFTGEIEFAAKGGFLTKEIVFDLDLKAKNISLPYFVPFYINNAPVFPRNGWFDMASTGRCRKNQVNGLQVVNVRDLELVVNPSNTRDNMAFGLPIMAVVNFFINSKGNLDFDFNITGTLSDPEFHIGEILQKILMMSIRDAILNKLSQLSNQVFEQIKNTGNIGENGKQLLNDVFQGILKPKEGQGQ